MGTTLLIILQILLQDFTPQNVNNIPVTQVDKARYYVIDMHSHDYAANAEEIDEWVKTMDACNVAKSTVHHCSWIGVDFETVVKKYAKYKDRFNF